MLIYFVQALLSISTIRGLHQMRKDLVLCAHMLYHFAICFQNWSHCLPHFLDLILVTLLQGSGWSGVTWKIKKLLSPIRGWREYHPYLPTVSAPMPKKPYKTCFTVPVKLTAIKEFTLPICCKQQSFVEVLNLFQQKLENPALWTWSQICSSISTSYPLDTISPSYHRF